MFLAIDESDEYEKGIIGCILSPQKNLPDLERDFFITRLDNNVFGEIKWQKITSSYCDKYIKFLNLIDNKNVTFHAICYRKKKMKYQASYILIRTITWKLINAGLKPNLKILFDEYGSLGKKGAEKINEISSIDNKFNLKIDFCNQGASHVIGCLQLCDLITGALSCVVNNIKPNEHQEKIINKLKKINNNIPIDYTSASLPKLFQYKIHYFDPDNKK